MSERFSENDEESMEITARILKVLQDDDIISEVEDIADDPKLSKIVDNDNSTILLGKPVNDVSAGYNLVRSISSPICASDEQTVPMIDSWEELGGDDFFLFQLLKKYLDSPIVAEKVYSGTKAVLRKIRAERKATQL